MTTKSVGLDLDSTLNDLMEKVLDRYNPDYGDCLTINDLTEWDTHNIVKPECGKKIWDYLLEEGFFLSFGVQPYSQEVTKFLSKYYDLYIVTAYKAENCVEKTEWIRKHFPHIPVKNIMFVNDKSKVDTDYLIDDGPHNIEGFKNTGLLIDAKYNEYLGDTNPRFYDWREIKKYFIETALPKDYPGIDIIDTDEA